MLQIEGFMEEVWAEFGLTMYTVLELNCPLKTVHIVDGESTTVTVVTLKMLV